MFNWISFLTYAVVTAVTPGPNNILSMSNGNRKGFRGALPFNFGILVGFSVVMLLCTAFCSLLSAWIPKIKLPMLIVGAAYMLYLAWETFRSSGVTEKDDGTVFGPDCSCSLSIRKFISTASCPWRPIFFHTITAALSRWWDLRCFWPSLDLHLHCFGRPLGLCFNGCFPNIRSW